MKRFLWMVMAAVLTLSVGGHAQGRPHGSDERFIGGFSASLFKFTTTLADDGEGEGGAIRKRPPPSFSWISARSRRPPGRAPFGSECLFGARHTAISLPRKPQSTPPRC